MLSARRSAGALALATALLAPLAAAAHPDATRTVPPPKGAPFALESCSVSSDATGAAVVLRVRNLDAARPLQRLEISLALADDVGIQKVAVPGRFGNLGIAPGVTAEVRDDYVPVRLDSMVRDSIRRATCRVTAAVFEGGARWTPAKRWKGRLLPATDAS